ncbi:MAG: hypothetical protein JXR70_12665 [Spirochaetales bacterium]|nr:hypothetical protein [Spirochaetales bacterium]
MAKFSYSRIWNKLYPHAYDQLARLTVFLDQQKKTGVFLKTNKQWYKEGTVYCVYPNAFEGGFKGLTKQISYFVELGISTIWLLPSLESPGRDQGFDISDYYQIAQGLGGNAEFEKFINAAHQVGLRVIFDIAVNHTSEENIWFKEACKSSHSFYHDFYHWQESNQQYPLASPVFPDTEDSIWTFHPEAKAYYLHFFYHFQPDLNYANPEVALEMIKVLAFWKAFGVDGFRMDAAPFLWKEEGTDCVNRPKVHLILKLFRAAMAYLAPGSLFLAESNLPSEQLLEYFGKDDECQAAYHFPLVPVFYEALYHQDPTLLVKVPFRALPPGGQYFTFLRCHDEVPLDLVSDHRRQELLDHYAPNEDTHFRGGYGFSGRLFELMDYKAEKVLAAFSLLLSLPGTPIVYYGDEVAMLNSQDFFDLKCKETGVFDSRFLHRGPWKHNGKAADKLFGELKKMLRFRKAHPRLFRAIPQLETDGPVLISRRSMGKRKLLIITNLSDRLFVHGDYEVEPYGRIWEFN